MLLHGLGGSRHSWTRIAPLLLPRFRLALLDLPGSGKSRDLPDPFTIEAIAEAACDVIDQLGAPTVTVAGHALGGLVATAVAEQAPDRVERLIAINSPVTLGSRLTTHSAAGRLLLRKGIGQVAWQARTDLLLRLSLADSFAPGFDPPEQVIQDLRSGTRTGFMKSSRAVDAYLRERPLPARFSALQMPTAVIFGSQDRRVDRAILPRLHAASPGTQIVELPESGHSPHWEAPERTAEAILEQPVRAK
jgi:pimeloyl-ACP methyl ester carboxylesterase